MRLFHPLKFMLASPIQAPEEIRRSIDGAFFVEDKYDGIRGQIHKSGQRLAIYSRTLDEITHRFPSCTRRCWRCRASLSWMASCWPPAMAASCPSRSFSRGWGART